MRLDTLSVSALEKRGLPVLEIVGEVDLLTAPLLERAVKDALEVETPALVLDLRPTSYIDSEGLKCIIRAKKALASRDAALWVAVEESSFVERILQVTGVLEVVRVCRDPDEIPAQGLPEQND